MSWRSGSQLFIDIWPAIQKNIPNRHLRVEFTAELLKLFVRGDMDPCDVEDVHPDIRAAMRVAGLEICEPYDLPHIGHGFVASSADGSHLLVSMGHLYASTNSGTTWMQQSIPGVLSAYGAGCVASSADGGKSYLALGADDYGHPDSIYTHYSLPKPHLQLATLERV